MNPEDLCPIREADTDPSSSTKTVRIAASMWSTLEWTSFKMARLMRARIYRKPFNWWSGRDLGDKAGTSQLKEMPSTPEVGANVPSPGDAFHSIAVFLGGFVDAYRVGNESNTSQHSEHHSGGHDKEPKTLLFLFFAFAVGGSECAGRCMHFVRLQSSLPVFLSCIRSPGTPPLQEDTHTLHCDFDMHWSSGGSRLQCYSSHSRLHTASKYRPPPNAVHIPTYTNIRVSFCNGRSHVQEDCWTVTGSGRTRHGGECCPYVRHGTISLQLQLAMECVFAVWDHSECNGPCGSCVVVERTR